MCKQVVRVAIANNFNCTNQEFKQLDYFASVNSDSKFFINSNINTKNLMNVTKHDYKVVVTANPNLFIDNEKIKRLYEIRNKISFVRVKYIPDDVKIQKLIKKLSRSFNVVITVMRFNGYRNLDKLSNRKYYEKSFGKMRLKSRYYKDVCRYADSLKRVYICDRKHLGCSGCNLCSTLNNEKTENLSSINLSTSGICKFNCVDCYAKTMQNFIVKCGNNPIEFDIIKKNKKQKGTNKFILSHKK